MSGERERLDDALSRVGQTITLRRRIGVTSTFSDVACKAIVRGYQPEKIVAGSVITQQDAQVIMSPSEIIAAGWSSGAASPADTRVPVAGNWVIVNGVRKEIQAAAGIYVADELVRLELTVRG